MSNKVILITGSNGEIGQSLICYLLENTDYKIITLDLDPLLKNLNILKHFRGSITDKKILHTINSQYQIVQIYHLAAILSSKAEQNSEVAYDVNVYGTMNLIDICSSQSNQYGHTILFFFPSSIAIYSIDKINDMNPIDEKMCCQNPQTVYGVTKLECEKIGVEKEIKNAGIDFRCIRFPGIISASSMPTGGTSDYAPEMVHAAALKKHYNCYVNEQTRLPFIVMPDAIYSIIKLMTASKQSLSTNIYNVSSFSPNISELQKMVTIFFPKFSLSYDINLKRQEIVNSWPNIINDNKARNDWRWKPRFNFENAYRNYIVPSIIQHYNLQENQ